MKQFSTARNKNDEIFQCYLQAYEEYKARIQASLLNQQEKFQKDELRKEELTKEHEENIFKYNEEYKARISALRQSHIKAEEKEYKARSFHKEVMDEMKKAFQLQEQGPEQEFGDEMAEEAPEAVDKHRITLINTSAVKNWFKPREKEAAELLSSKEEPEAGDKDDSKTPK